MPRPVAATAKVKKYRMTTSERAKAARFADSLKPRPSESSLFLGWVENFLKHGSDYQPDPPTVVQIVGPAELFREAEEKAQREHGVGLREILRYEISQLDLL
jgi:hypothetical protein